MAEGSKDARSKGEQRKVRYAVVGLGWIAQTAMLPGFANASHNSELAALVSDDETKRQKLSQQYGVPSYSYAQYEQALQREAVDAVYIALPDPLHAEYTMRAARVGVNVLCEKPMAVTSAECKQMIAACQQHKVKLMVAYRLHFDESNLSAVEVVQSGQLGEPRIFSATFSQQLAAGNVRLAQGMADGSLYDLGIYCINAARYLFRAEPSEVVAFSATGDDPRFGPSEEMTAALLRFPGERLAQFVSSFGATFNASYEVIGTKGKLRLDPGFGGETSHHYLTIDGRTTQHDHHDHDHFGPQLSYFSDCILQDREPEPNGEEGLIDVLIVEALYRSAREGCAMQLDLPHKQQWPDLDQAITYPSVAPAVTVKTRSPTE
jgi:predicted dehydrogenase